MTEIISTLNEFLKEQLKVHGDQIWLALLFVAPAMAFIYGMTRILKGFVKKVFAKGRFRDSIIQASVLGWGVVYMLGHSIFFPVTFNWKQRIVGGIGLGVLNIVLYHVREWWKKRKEK